MQQTAVQDEIQELNLTYLLLSQRMLAEDRVTAMFRLKIDDETADLLQSLSSRQLAKLARCNQVLFGLHFHNVDQLVRATSNKHESGLAQAHAALFLAAAPGIRSQALG